ncbi:MerR family redox-sensitive transcriptional activator SoxR [Streptosporangium album]|uniref:MerR family redox-sensitive transcriptional activator SoxR n=1 Tax=Streptosporangium album TaxID=47479 RepID=A0A7W7S432_9ACTN|nr:MerR family DNA-binding protein [Streptosporangium album]MBB4943292.1 MerR family redox-sensitive transcriptional activator SoxR [Streptosporangium album]
MGQAGQHSGIPPGSILASRRTTGNQRRYHRSTLRRVAFIRASQSVGMPLSTIGGVLGFLPEGVPPTREFWLKASACWSEEINTRIEKMERMRDRFTECPAEFGGGIGTELGACECGPRLRPGP